MWSRRPSPRRATTPRSVHPTKRSALRPRSTAPATRPTSISGAAALLEVPTTDKVELALALEAATLAADPRVRGVETAEYGDTASETAVATSAGIRAEARRTVCSLVTFALAEANAETQTGYGFSVGRTYEDLDLEAAARDAAERATRLLGARQPASRRLAGDLRPAGDALLARSGERGVEW